MIGNGFDIAHELPTKYFDFKNYLLSYEKEPEMIMDGFVRLDSISPQERARHNFYEAISKYIPKQDLWCSFEKALGFLDYEQIQEDNSCYFLDYGDDNWRDSANHDFQYMIGEDLSFARDIPKYFFEWIKSINTRVKPILQSNIFMGNCLFLNFNYTDTLEQVYAIPTSKILYIHGNALCGDDLILGHHDASLFQERVIPAFNSEEEYEIYMENNMEEDFRLQEARAIIKEYFKKTYKDTTSIICQNQAFFYSLKNIDEVWILGHSLSEIDFFYFLEIKKYVPLSCQWNISYHDDCTNAQNLVRDLKIKNYQLFRF